MVHMYVVCLCKGNKEEIRREKGEKTGEPEKRRDCTDGKNLLHSVV